MIRKSKIQDLDECIRIYESARKFMHTNGNPTQWAGKYPDAEILIDDIEKGQLYAVESDREKGRICGCFVLASGDDPTYSVIYDGEWKDNTPYMTIHRIASDRSERGVFEGCFAFAKKFCNHLRVDTHKDNIPMRNAAKKLGFEYRGIIHLADGSPRMAFEWTD